MNATTYAVDIAKTVFQLHWVEPGSGEIHRRKLSRAKFIEFFARLRPARVVMEACGGAHHWGRSWARWVTKSSCCPRVRCAPSCAATRTMRPMRARSGWPAQQATSGACPSRAPSSKPSCRRTGCVPHWVSVRTASVNALRGLLYEFGVVLPRGKRVGLKVLARAPRGDRRAAARDDGAACSTSNCRRCASSRRQVTRIEAEIEVVQKTDANGQCACARCRASGVLGATALAAALGDGSGLAQRARVRLLPGPDARAQRHRRQGAHGRHHQTRRPLPANAADHGARASPCDANAPEWIAQTAAAPALQRGGRGGGPQAGPHRLGDRGASARL